MYKLCLIVQEPEGTEFTGLVGISSNDLITEAKLQVYSNISFGEHIGSLALTWDEPREVKLTSVGSVCVADAKMVFEHTADALSFPVHLMVQMILSNEGWPSVFLPRAVMRTQYDLSCLCLSFANCI